MDIVRKWMLCPLDQGTLVWSIEGDAARCRLCDAHITRHNGVFATAGVRAGFYEGRFTAQVRYLPRRENLIHLIPLWFVNSGYVWAVRSLFTPNAVIAELGCGGGVRYFGRRFNMVGVDLSIGSLEKAAEIYGTTIHCDINRGIPIAADSLDGIISSSFLEHIAPSQKGHLISEAYRVLKPGGRLIFVFDVDTENPLIRRMRRIDPERYKRLFLDADGHVGYESMRANVGYFERAGFRSLKITGIEKTPLVSLPSFQKFSEWDGVVGRLSRAMMVLNYRFSNFAYQGMLRALDIFPGSLLPNSWARVGVIACEKPH